ncbi:MAG TPA: TIGR03118 family protein, partial [Pseudomonadales bacterium]|nr:TIGR03118 family protein [Pseudomonadales bacterium]
LQRVALRGFLNAPWGIALAPAGFGTFAGRLLVGNFGDGRINAFDLATGRWVGMLTGTDRRPLSIDGLWGLSFGNGFVGQQIDSLYFTAGPDDESHGVYGVVSPTTASKGGKGQKGGG